MDALRISACSVRPFDKSTLMYLHCIDLQTEKFTPVTSFSCLEICCVLGHFSFPRELAVRRLCCFLWSKESKAKLAVCQSPVLLNAKSSCYFTVIMILVSQMNKVNLRYVVCVGLLRFYGVLSRLPLAPRQKKERRNKACSSVSRPSRTPPGFCPFYPTSTRPSPSSLGHNQV